MTDELVLPLLGALLLVLGALGVVLTARERLGAAVPGWGPDPTSASGRLRWWDGAAWAPQVETGGPSHGRGRRFRGRFWGVGWVLPAFATVAVAVAGGVLWMSTRADAVLFGIAVVAQILICVAFYRFVDRQVALGEEIAGRTVVAATVAAAGATMLVAHPLDDLVETTLGDTAALAFAGPVEELTKLLVPMAVLLLVGWWRTPRAGLALGLASGFGFGIAEGGFYALWVPRGETVGARGAGLPDASGDLALTLDRLVLGEPLHFLLTGFVCVVAWRQWHHRGALLTAPVLGAVVLAMGLHSLNDVLTVSTGGSAAAEAVGGLVKYALLPVMYLVLRAAARGSLPPGRVDVVSRGWHPRRLPTDAEHAVARDREPVA